MEGPDLESLSLFVPRPVATKGFGGRPNHDLQWSTVVRPAPECYWREGSTLKVPGTTFPSQVSCVVDSFPGWRPREVENET